MEVEGEVHQNPIERGEMINKKQGHQQQKGIEKEIGKEKEKEKEKRISRE